MATLGNTAITSGGFDSPFPMAGGLRLEVWQVAGGAVGDTSTIQPKFGGSVISVISGQAATHNASTLGSSTNVTLTLTASASTSAVFDTFVLCKP